jgi:hypothetical protein
MFFKELFPIGAVGVNEDGSNPINIDYFNLDFNSGVWMTFPTHVDVWSYFVYHDASFIDFFSSGRLYSHLDGD